MMLHRNLTDELENTLKAIRESNARYELPPDAAWELSPPTEELAAYGLTLSLGAFHLRQMVSEVALRQAYHGIDILPHVAAELAMRFRRDLIAIGASVVRSHKVHRLEPNERLVMAVTDSPRR